MKKNNQPQKDFQVSFIRPYKVRSAQNKKGTKSVLIYLNSTTIISLNEAFIKSVLQNKKALS